MAASDPVQKITPDDRVPGDPTPGMTREQAIAIEGLWSGLVRTDGHMTSGWHHHGDYDTAIYVVSGSLHMESGPGGGVILDAVSGDFVYVPRGAVHRESNPGEFESQLLVTRAGAGPAVINVDRPAPL